MSDAPSPKPPQTRAFASLPAVWQLAALGLLAAGILGLGLVPGLGHPLGDKTEHVIAFALLALLFRRSRTLLARPVLCFGVLFLAAAALEVLQGAFLRSRVASESDALASCIGIVCGIAASWLRGRRLAAALAGIVVLALATNWTLNVGRYKVQDMLPGAAAPAGPAALNP